MAIQFFGLDTGGGGPDTQAPSVPANLTRPRDQYSISLAWSASTDNVGVTGYQVLRAPGASGGTFTQIATSASNSFCSTPASPPTAPSATRYAPWTRPAIFPRFRIQSAR